MSRQRALKLVHAAGTAWFLLGAGLLFAQSLRQAGVKWWVIFSLSGYSATSVLVLISAYLFAIFRSSSRNQSCSIEHPLTSSTQYTVLYSLMPFLGTLAGIFGSIGIENFDLAVNTVIMGTLMATFAFWIVVDPAIAMIEAVLPQSRAHRSRRIWEMHDLRTQQQNRRRQIMEELDRQEVQNKHIWQSDFEKDAQILAALAAQAKKGDFNAARRAAQIGLDAFKRGGLECMQVVHEMAVAAARRQGTNGTSGDYISSWWDGIGPWRCKYILGAEN